MTGGDPIQVPWDRAVSEIHRRLSDLDRPNNVVLGISGPVGSGKSTLAAALDATVIPTDDYLPNYDDTPEHERDDPTKADLPLLAEHLRSLRNGEPAPIPCWSFTSHRREGSRLVHPTPLIVCEGIHALHPLLVDFYDLRIFVDAPADVRSDRWEQIEAKGERGWGVDRALRYMHQIADPTFERFRANYLAAAHIVVDNGR